MRKLRSLRTFVCWVLPEDGCSLRLWATLLRILVYGRQSVYCHFKVLRTATSGARLKSFFNGLSSAQVPRDGMEGVTVPVRLLARLLRAIYLTEVLPRKDPVARANGPNDGYSNHPHFTYGEPLQTSTRASTRDGHRE